MTDADCYVNAGQALLQLGRYLQRTYPVPTTVGNQYPEDEAVLAKLLPPEGLDMDLYVDIGASFPQECSNSWQFYKRGWRGLLIEPLSDCWPSILLDRPQDQLCPLAASNVTGFATLRVCQSVSSLQPDWNITPHETIPVRTDTLKNILARYPWHDWRNKTRLCSIDVEGHEREVLEGFDWATFKPTVIVVEFRSYDPEKPGPDVSANWRHILEGNGYSLHHEGELNQIYAL